MGLPQGRIVTLLNNRNIDGSGGDAPVTTGIIDLRRASSISAIFSRGSSVVSQPDYKVEYAEGLALEFGQYPEDAFEAYVHDALVNTTGVGNENWIVTPMPKLYMPAVRFKVTALAGSPSGARFWLYAYVIDREAVG